MVKENHIKQVNKIKNMTQEDKELLLKDLCARIPYGVKMNHIADNEHSPKTLIGVAKDMITLKGLGGYECVDVEDYKPYLFPLSSMSEGQMFDFATVQSENCKGSYPTLSECSTIIDWGYKHHFDVNSLIEKGLAIDATGLNIY